MALTDNLISYYKMENTSDSVGTNTLTNTGSTTFTAAKINNGADGGAANTTKWLSNSVTPISFAQFPVAWSISGWAKMYSIATDSTIVSLGATDSVHRYYCDIQIQGATGHILARGYPISPTTYADGGLWPDTTGFHHVVFTYNGTNMTIYMDNSLKDTQAFAFQATDATNLINTTGFLRDVVDGNSTASAVVDEFGFWTRVLTVPEISQLYNSGAGLQYPFSVAGGSGGISAPGSISLLFNPR